MADLIKIAEEAFATGKQTPAFKAGDTVTVAYKIVEGNKERVQLYRGVVIKISGHGDKKRFTVRKMSGTVGVERIFPIESPAIESIEVNKMVRCAALSSTTSVTSRVRRHASRKSVPPSRRRHKQPTKTMDCDTSLSASTLVEVGNSAAHTPIQRQELQWFLSFLLPPTGTIRAKCRNFERIIKNCVRAFTPHIP